MGRAISEQNPSGTETFGYDSNSNLIKQVRFQGQERDFVFDDLNRTGAAVAITWHAERAR
jgi:YD repeat-containing protein